jgi:hypothetical protein
MNNASHWEPGPYTSEGVASQLAETLSVEAGTLFTLAVLECSVCAPRHISV